MKVVRPRRAASIAASTSSSVWASTALVGSSSSRIGGSSRRRARSPAAGAARPTGCARPPPAACRSRRGSSAMNSCAPASRAARSIAARLASGWPKAMLSATCRERAGSPGTPRPTLRRSALEVELRARRRRRSAAARAVGIVEARDQPQQRALARAGRAHERHAAGPGATAKSTPSSARARRAWPKLDALEADRRRGIVRRARTGLAGGFDLDVGASSTSNTRRAAITLCSSVFRMVAIPGICAENCCSSPANTTTCPSVIVPAATRWPP